MCVKSKLKTLGGGPTNFDSYSTKKLHSRERKMRVEKSSLNGAGPK